MYRIFLCLSVLAFSLAVQLSAQITLTSSASPSTATPGSTTVTITGSNFPSGTIAAADLAVTLTPDPSLSGAPTATVAASNIQTVVASTRRVTFSVPTTLVVSSPSLYRVTLSGPGISSVNFSALTINPIPGILSTTPTSLAPGAVAALLIRTQNGAFVQDAASLSLGAGLSSARLPLGAESPQPLYGANSAPLVVDSNTILALVRVDPNADAGPRSLTLTQGPLSFARPDAISISTTPGPNTSTLAPSLSPATTPESGTPNATTFTLSVTGLPATTIAANQIRLYLEPVAASSSPRFTVIPTSLSADSAGLRTLSFAIPSNLSFSALTDYAITLYGSTSNYGQLPTGLTWLAQNRSLIRLGPPPAPAPTLSSLSPLSGTQGQTFTLTVTGLNTNFTNPTQLTLGPGLAIGGAPGGQFGPVSVVNPTTVTAQVRIEPGAALGSRNLDLRTGNLTLTLRDAFLVNAGSFQISLAPPQPASLRPGQSASIVASNFPPGDLGLNNLLIALAPQRAGAAQARNILASAISPLVNNTRTITYTFPPDIVTTAPEPFNIAISGQIPNGASFSTVTPAQLTLLPPARLISIAPNSGQPGTSFTATINGSYTSFAANQTSLNLGTGITMTSVTVQSPTLLTANLVIAPNAAAGPRNLTVSTGAGILTLSNAFSIAGAPAPLTLSSTTSPSAARPGATVSFTASNFPNGNVLPNQLIVTLEPAAGGPSLTFPPSGIQENAPGQRTIFFSIPTSITVTQPTNYLVSLSGINASSQPFNSANKAALTIEPASLPLQITSILPASAAQGQSVNVTISLSNAALAVLPQLSFGPVIVVSNLALASPNQLTATLNIGPAASLGLREVILTANGQSTTARLFTVLAAPAAPPALITSIAPTLAPTGTSVNVTITGQNTQFTSQSVVSLGLGISPGPITVQSPTQITTTLTIAPDAPPGSRTLTVTTGAQSATLANAFSVIGPQITLISPTDKSFVNTTSITVQGTVNDPTATIAVNGVAAPNNGGSFTVAIPLSEGNNTVTAMATTSGGATSSNSLLVNLDTTPPRVAVLSPADLDETTEERINVAGNVNDIVVGTVNDIQAQVTVNGVPAQVNNRSFVASNIPLQPGMNTLSVVARDRVGNAFTASIKVNRVMAPLLKVNVIGGNNQSARINTALPQPVVVQLTDGLGIPKPNTSVFFRVAGNNGRVTPASTTPGALAIEVKTDGEGKAQALWTLGSRSGAGINRLEVGATGVTAPALFTATGTPAPAARIVVDSGLNQTGAVGQRLPLPFVAVVIDEGNNRLGGVPVTLTVRAGNGKIEGQSETTRISDPDGRIASTLTLGPEEGNENNEVVANFTGNTANPAIFTASGRIPKRVEDTKVSGVVLDNANQPIPGVTVKLLRLYQGASSNLPQQVGPSGTSNANGYFEILGAPTGVFKLLADGTTVTGQKKYPTLEFDITTVAGQNNTVGTPIHLPSIDTESQLCVNESIGGTLTLKQIPGFSLRVAAGSATFPGGAKHGCITVTPVNIDKVPMSPGFGQQPRFVVTIQPVGTQFTPPAGITIPNVETLNPGQVTELYSYDHDLAAFVSIGNGVVSSDGLVITSAAGSGVTKAGWHCGGDPAANGHVADCPDCQICRGNSCMPNFEQRACSKGTCFTCIAGSCERIDLGSSPSNPDACCYNGNPVGKTVGVFEELLDNQRCPQRQQRTDKPHEIDGCSIPGITVPQIFPDGQDPMRGKYGPDILAVRSTAFGEPVGPVSPKDAGNQTLPCNRHDVCYQTCGGPLRSECDEQLYRDIVAVCEKAYPAVCPWSSPTNPNVCVEYSNQRDQCFYYAALVKAGLDVGGAGSYYPRQVEYCQCCQ